MVKVEGFWGLWRGNLANIIRVVPNKGVLLMCSDMYKATIAAALPGCGGATISSIAGGLAGLTAVLEQGERTPNSLDWKRSVAIARRRMRRLRPGP